MDVIEYLLFIPLLLYGIALSDLFGEWKKILNPNSDWYPPYLLAVIMITETGVFNVFIFFKISPLLNNANYFEYWLYLLPPFIFLLSVNFLTHRDESVDMKTFFVSRITPVSLLTAAFIALHFVPMYHFEQNLTLTRILGISCCLAYALTKKHFLFYIVIALWILSLVLRIYNMVTAV